MNRYFCGSNTVKIYVGPERKLWVLPEDLICEKVDYFRAAFKTGFKESIEKEIHMVEDDAAAFAHLIDWLFGQRVDCGNKACEDDNWENEKGGEGKDTIPKAQSHFQKISLEWCKLFVLADKLGLKGLAFAALANIEYCSVGHQYCASSEAISFAYENTSTDSLLRCCLADQAMINFIRSDTDSATFAEAMTSNTEFASQVARKIKSHALAKDSECKEEVCGIHYNW